jgi:hypothetical protein
MHNTMRAHCPTYSRASALLMAAVCLGAGLSACGNGAAENSVGVHNDTSTTTTPPPPSRVFDLRFKGVGVLSSSVDLAHTNITANAKSALSIAVDSAAGTPLQIGAGTCSSQECSWFFDTFALPGDIARLGTAYRASVLANLQFLLDTVSTDTVIPSLDLQPAVGVFALSEFSTSRAGGYHLTQRLVPLSGLQAAASSDGAEGRVITALSFDAGRVRYVSYSWQHDSTPSYDAKVVQATLSTAGAAAQALAADGYFVTALGGDTTDGFVLVGTRVQGLIQARSVLINPTPDTDLTGYAVVGDLVDATTRTGMFIVER